MGAVWTKVRLYHCIPMCAKINDNSMYLSLVSTRSGHE
jgi:hypothetical protein